MTHPVSPDAERRPDRAALLIGVALGLLGALVLLDAQSVRGGAYARIGPATFPTVIGGFLLILAVWTVASAWRGRFPEREPSDTGPVIWVVAGLALQLLLLHPAGFSIATGLLFALTARAFGKRKLWISLPVGILFSLAIWLLFTQVLRLALPAGPLEQLFT